MEKQVTVEIWNPDENPASAKAALPSFGAGRVGVTSVAVTDISVNLREILTSFQDAFSEVPVSPAGFVIDEIELSLGINGKGGFAIIGKLEMGAQAGVKVKIKRKPQP